MSGTRERSIVVTSGQSISMRLPAGSRRYICTEPSGSSYMSSKNESFSAIPSDCTSS